MLGAFEMSTFCVEAGGLLQIVGYVLTIVKIAMPLIIIVYGVMDLGKAVVAAKEDEIKTGAKRLMWRAVAGVAIFFIPSIVLWVFGTINQYSNSTEGFENCQKCILSPWNGCNTSKSNY